MAKPVSEHQTELGRESRSVSPAGRSPHPTVAVATGATVLLITVLCAFGLRASGTGDPFSDPNHLTVANEGGESI